MEWQFVQHISSSSSQEHIFWELRFLSSLHTVDLPAVFYFCQRSCSSKSGNIKHLVCSWLSLCEPLLQVICSSTDTGKKCSLNVAHILHFSINWKQLYFTCGFRGAENSCIPLELTTNVLVQCHFTALRQILCDSFVYKHHEIINVSETMDYGG